MNPVNQLNRITSSEFYTDRKGRLNDYLAYLNGIYDGSVFTKVKGQKGYSFINHEGDVMEFVPESGIYIVQCYGILELQLRQGIAEKAKELNAITEVSLYVEKVIKRLHAISKEVETVQLTTGLEQYRSQVVAKLQNCILTLMNNYHIDSRPQVTRPESTTEVKPKLRWLGNKKVLATLIYDLWKGQEILSEPKKKTRLRSVLEATKKQDVVEFIVSNFLDADGNPLNPKVIDEYLNSSKSKASRRIDLRYTEAIFSGR